MSLVRKSVAGRLRHEYCVVLVDPLANRGIPTGYGQNKGRSEMPGKAYSYTSKVAMSKWSSQIFVVTKSSSEMIMMKIMIMW